MDQTKNCPMCGAQIATDAQRCLSCGESISPITADQTFLRGHATPIGLLPTAIVGTIAGGLVGLILFICEWISRPNIAPELGGIVTGVSCCLCIGAVVGSTVGAIRGGVRRVQRDSNQR
jgi:hypothetical protein